MLSRLTEGLWLAATRRIDENELRVPPPPATPLQFPSCYPQEPSSTGLGQLDIVNLFKDLFAPGAQLKHVEAFRILHVDNVKLEELISSDWLPSLSLPENISAVTEDSESDSTIIPPSKLSNGRVAPSSKDFFDLVKELMYDNGDAFRTARRQPAPPGRVVPKIVHSRKVWNGIADMAEYWDTSLDRYMEDNDTKDHYAMDVDEPRAEAEGSKSKDSEGEKKKTYMGRRTNTGSKMPKTFREDTVAGFIEMVIWAFGCTLDDPPTPQSHKLVIQNVVHTLPFFKSVHRMPEDRRKARAGVREGPLMGVFCRHQTEFRKPDDPEGIGKGEIFDLLRESGILTLTAQKRAREGKVPKLEPGKAKWWATAPRWGGSKGGEFGGADDEPVEDSATIPGNAQPRKRTKRETQEQMWRAMRPPPSLWDRNVEYKCIGKEKGSDYDDIYLISSLNHHVSILHTRIHNRFLDYLSAPRNPTSATSTTNDNHTTTSTTDTANPPTDAPQQQPWYGLTIRRSKWYDLFSAHDRVELLRGVWGITACLMRAETEEEEEMKEVRKEEAGVDKRNEDGKE